MTDDGTREWSTDAVSLKPEEPVLHFVVIDDTDTNDTAAFRERLAAPFAGVMGREAFRIPGTFYDPAAWHPLDYRVVVGYPSAGVEQRYRTSIDGADLTWITNAPSEAELDQFVRRVERAMTIPPQAERPYLPIETFERGIRLAFREIEPTTAAEEQLVQWSRVLPERVFLNATLATARDDEGTGAFTMPQPPFPWETPLLIRAVVPAGPPDDSPCWATEGVGRVFDWLQENHLGPAEPTADPECDLRTTSIFSSMSGGWPCTSRCLPRPRTDTAGRADCRLFVDTIADSCNQEKGWRATDEVTAFEPAGFERSVTCEIPQLEGSALTACRESVECPECGGGFCLTRLPEALESCEHDCSDEEVPMEAFRLTGGAGIGRGWLTIRCRSDDAIGFEE